MLPVLLSALLLTQNPIVKADTSSRPVASAARRAGDVAIDGRLDEAAWSAARAIDQFTQQVPTEGTAPTQRTEVRILYDDDAIYIGARMFDSQGAAGVTRQLVRRDQTPESDRLSIHLDPFHDRLHSVEFQVNPSGSRADASDGDASWDPVWESAARVDSIGWTAEIRIPFSQLRFSREAVQTWGLNITRWIHRLQERDMWSYWRQKDVGGPSYFGELAGLQITAQPRHIELMPYAVARAHRLNSSDPRSPFHDPNRSDVRVGGDFKYRLTPSFTLSAAVNPDFGQVEVDPAVINLSAYETFFSERRPFFVESSDLFNFGQPGCNINCGFGLALFYSRRIGRSPQGTGLAYGLGEFVDVPENTTILGAAKLTGRTRDGWSVGIIDAVTREETAEVATSDGRFLEQTVEPFTNSFVGRVKRELRGGNLVVGGIVTSVNRDLDDDGLRSLLPSSAQTAGADVQYYWGNRNYSFYAAVSGSHVTGDSLAIRRVQRTSARYFQRPDREEFLFDPKTESLDGAGFIARLAKQGGNYIWDLNAATNSPGLEINDAGFFSRADWSWLNGTFGRQFTTPTSWYRSVFLMMGAEQHWNYDGDRTGSDMTGVFELQLLNYWNASVVAARYFESLNDRLTRGGPVVGQPGSWYTSFGLSSDPRRKVRLTTSVQVGTTDEGGHDESLSVSAVIRPAPNIRLTFGPGYSRSGTTDQYVTRIEDPTATAFFGNRYVFAHLDQRQLFMNTRANITFSPTLSLELFAQPLIASGDYYNFEEFAAPREQRKLIYGRDVGTITTSGPPDNILYTIDPDASGPAASFTLENPNFNFRSLRGTSVLRWEWRPGSTVFLVWTQTRSGSEPFGDLVFSRDRRALFETPADNIFAVKVSYWLGL